MTRALAAIVALAALATVPAGCGGDDGEALVTPASTVPADALVYADVVLRPEGEERTAVEAPLAALLDTEDPGRVLIEELDRSLADYEAALTYAEDVEPWLGERAALFFSAAIPEDAGFLDSGFDGAFVLDSTDAGAARAAIDRVTEAEDPGEAEAASYEGTGYASVGELAVGVVGDAVVFGSERGFEEVVDTEAGGDSLADDPGYAEAMGDDVGETATLFVDAPAIVDAAGEAGEVSAADREALDTVFAGAAEQPLTAVVDAQTTGFGFELSHGAGELPLLSAGAESSLLRDLPRDSWLAAGFADAGGAIGAFVSSARDLGVAADELESARDRIRREYGVELEELYEPLGDGAAFASGEGIFGAGGGIVFETSDPGAAQKAIGGLERAAKRGGEEVRRLAGPGGETGFSIDVPNTPGSINFVAGKDRVVIAYGEAATVAALDPGEAEGTLAGSEEFTAAESALGEGYDVSGFLDFAPVADLLDLAAATNPSLQEVLPYLEALDFLIAGSRSDGERERRRVFLGISGITTEPAA